MMIYLGHKFYYHLKWFRKNKSCKVTSYITGDIVMGFFLDGDDAQMPVILGMFANTPDYYGGTSDTPHLLNHLQDIQVKLNQILISSQK